MASEISDTTKHSHRWYFVLTLFLALALVSHPSQASIKSPDAPIVGFQAWKNMRMESAKSELEKLEGASKASVPKPANKVEIRDPRLLQAQVNLDIASELTVNDYFLLYLREFTDRESFIEAAKKLSAEEVADLLQAYQKNVSGSPDLDVLVPAAAQLPQLMKSGQKRN